MKKEILLHFENVKNEIQQQLVRKLQQDPDNKEISLKIMDHEVADEINENQFFIRIDNTGLFESSQKIISWDLQQNSIDKYAEEILNYLQNKKNVTTDPDPYTEEEKKAVQKRLRDLGYL